MSLYKILLSLCSETQKLDPYNKPKNAPQKRKKIDSLAFILKIARLRIRNSFLLILKLRTLSK